MNENSATQAGASQPQKKTSWGKRLLIGLFVIFLGLQLIPVERANPAVEADILAPEEVKAVLRRACYDCHSNETKWPWYCYVAPVSWLASKDVIEGRNALNFSDWGNEYPSEEEAAEAFRDYGPWESIENGTMPLWFYLPLHPEAVLTQQDLEVLKKWAGIEAEEESVAEEETATEEAEETVEETAPKTDSPAVEPAPAS